MDQEADKDMSRGEGDVEHNIEVVEENAGKSPFVLIGQFGELGGEDSESSENDRSF